MQNVLRLSDVPGSFFHDAPDPILDLIKLQRELFARIAAKHAAEQLGEAFEGLDLDRRNS
jgi:hypothetical protein